MSSIRKVSWIKFKKERHFINTACYILLRSRSYLQFNLLNRHQNGAGWQGIYYLPCFLVIQVRSHYQGNGLKWVERLTIRKTTNSEAMTLSPWLCVSPRPHNGGGHLCLVSANVTTAEGNLWSNVTRCHTWRVTPTPCYSSGNIMKVCNWPVPAFYFNSPLSPHTWRPAQYVSGFA